MRYYTINQKNHYEGIEFSTLREIADAVERANPGILFDDILRWGGLVFCVGNASEIKHQGAIKHVAIDGGVAVFVPKEKIVTLQRGDQTFYLSNGISTDLTVSIERPKERHYPEGEVYQHIKNWYTNGDVGLSSLTMCAAMYPELRVYEPKAAALPRNYAEFNRCMQFLHAVPGAFDNLEMMRSVSMQWSNLIDEWFEVEAAYHAGDVNVVGSKLGAIGEDSDDANRVLMKAAF